jgi:two-component system OmpR family sensor kinase
MGLLAVLLVLAGGAEYALLRGAVISSRGQAMGVAFSDARGLVARQDRLRVRSGRPPLTQRQQARELVGAIAAGEFSAVALSPRLAVVASAAPGGSAHPQPVTGVSVPLLPPAELASVLSSGTHGQPTLIGQGSDERLAMAFTLDSPAGGPVGLVEVVQSAAAIQQELGRARLVLGLGTLGVLLLALLIGLWVTSRSLRRLERLTNAARRLGGGELSARSGLPDGGDEVAVLAGVFDQMAEAVEKTVAMREEATRQMRRFIADASHELRTPLTAIKGYLEVLERGAADDPQVLARALQVMSQEAERMRRLVTDLLALARADSSRALELRPVDLTELLQDFLEERGADPAVGAQGPLLAQADPEALLTIVSNLQGNAERHGQGLGITWTLIQDGQMVGFSCSDQGPGIAADDLPHIFERFYRAGESRSRGGGGSGLGLAIVKSLVEAQGGQVSASSGPSGGATFTVLLPAARAGGWVPPPA